jgi:hypothetical protein
MLIYSVATISVRLNDANFYPTSWDDKRVFDIAIIKQILLKAANTL